MNQRAPSSLVLLLASTLAASFAACGDDGGGEGGGGTGGDLTTAGSTSTGSTSTASTGGTGGSVPVVPTPPGDPGEPWELLSEWNLFVDGPAQVPAERVAPYEVIAPLFSDEAAKRRFMFVPEGATIGYEDEGPWRFPPGTVLVKTFAYPEDVRDEGSPLRLMETRLLWRLDDGWKPLTYVWNEDQTEAERTSAGDVIPVAWTDAAGDPRELDYVVPNTNQCKDCHERGEEDIETLGGWTLQLDLEESDGNQIDRLAALGFFEATPTPAEDRTRLVDPSGEADLTLRTRSYMHGNCGSCHTAFGSASTSALLLDFGSSDPETDPDNVGICKTPSSAGGATCGLTFDVVPGHPEQSIMICRVDTADTEVRMPPLGRQLVHAQGVDLLRAFIAELPPASCTPDPEPAE